MDDRPAPSPTLALLTLARRADLEVARLFEPHGLTVRKHRMLQLVAETPGLSHGAVARATGMEVRGVPTAVRALQASGLIRERRDGGHAGSLYVTADGSALLRRLDAELATLDARLFDTEELREVARAVVTADDAAIPAAPQD